MKIQFRGAGALAYFYIGYVLFLSNKKQIIQWQGISSGALVAYLCASSFGSSFLIWYHFLRFEILLHQCKKFIKYKFYDFLTQKKKNIAILVFEIWLFETRLRYRIVPLWLRSMPLPPSGYCKIIAFDVVSKKIVTKSEWKNQQELVHWLQGAMAIPFVTSSPVVIDQYKLMDAFSLPSFNNASIVVSAFKSPFVFFFPNTVVTPCYSFGITDALGSVPHQKKLKLLWNGMKISVL